MTQQMTADLADAVATAARVYLSTMRGARNFGAGARVEHLDASTVVVTDSFGVRFTISVREDR